MAEMKKLSIYAIKHSSWRDDYEELVEAENVQDAIELFERYYNDDVDMYTGKITSVELKYNFSVISKNE